MTTRMGHWPQLLGIGTLVGLGALALAAFFDWAPDGVLQLGKMETYLGFLGAVLLVLTGVRVPPLDRDEGGYVVPVTRTDREMKLPAGRYLVVGGVIALLLTAVLEIVRR